MDVTRTKKTASASTTGGGSRRLIIQSRPIMNGDPEVESGSQPEPATAPTLPPAKKVIVPISADASEEAVPPAQPAVKDEPRKAPVQPSKTAHQDAPSVETAEEAEESPREATPVEPAPEEAKAQDQASPATTPDAEMGSENSDIEKPSPETEKAVEEAAKAEARERELEDYIDKREFFVPINAVARKRSVKVNAGLTVFVLLLAVVLIDLMLDTGVILLVQKIPHTHFFTTQQ